MSVNAVNKQTGNLLPLAGTQTYQYSAMPPANSDNLNKIIQYVGTTTSSYTNGYFYKCVFNDPSYAWEEIQVSEGGNVGDMQSSIYDPNETVANAGGIVDYVDDKLLVKQEYWETKTWNGLTSLKARNVWSDGNNIYYSYGSTQYVLNNSSTTWSAKTWSGLSNFDGEYIWSDGDNVYYSDGSTQYVLNKTNSTWSTKTWNGLTSFYGDNIWIDGDNIYYSFSSFQYVLNKSTSTWSTKAWSGLTEFNGNRTWTDGDNVYYSNNSTSAQYVLDKTTSTWSTKTWTGLTDFSGDDIWVDGDNVYCSRASTIQYVLDKSTSTWMPKTWSGFTNFFGSYIWKDNNNNIYCSDDDIQYALISKILSPVKSIIKEYTISNSDSSKYYVAISDARESIGANEILAVTIAEWGGAISNSQPFSVAYSKNSNCIYIMFQPHAFSDAKVGLLISYR